MKILKILSFPMFLSTFVISFFIPSIYKEIIFFEFAVLAPLVLISSFQPSSLSQTSQILFILFTASMLFFGVPGSALGYFVSASIGLFVSQKELSNFRKHKLLDYRFFIFTLLCFLAASLYILYLNFKNPFSYDLISSYFGIASLNYASVTVASFCLIFSVWCIRRQIAGTYFSFHQQIVLRILSGILAATVFVLFTITETRAVLFSFLPPFLYALQPKKLYHFIGIILTSILVLSLTVSNYLEYFLSFIAPGHESIVTLYNIELFGTSYFQSAFTIFRKAIPYMSICIGCSEYISYSGISNLIALSFPFSLYFVFKILSFLVKYLIHIPFLIKASPLFYLIIILSFLSSAIQVVFQADFLSVVSLFYVVGSGLIFLKNTSSKKATKEAIWVPVTENSRASVS